MNIPQLIHYPTHAKLDMQVTKPTLDLERQNATFVHESSQPKWQVTRTPGKLTIDQTAAWEAMHLKSAMTVIGEEADKGKQAALSGTARRSREGDEMMAIESGGKPLIDQAVRNAYTQEFDTNIGFIPPVGSVKIHYEPSKLNSNWEIRKPNLSWQTYETRYNYTPGRVMYRMEQNPTLQFDVRS